MTPATPPPEVKALFDAILQSDAAQVNALLAADPRLSAARNADGATAVLWSVYTRHPELAPQLLEGREPDLYEACALGNRERAAALLKLDPKLADSFSADGFPALGLAIFFGHVELARMLVEAGADVNQPSRNALHVYPMHAAAASGNAALVELLLGHGAKADPEPQGATPLHSAASQGNREMVEKLLAAGADKARKTDGGKTAAELAREKGYTELAAALEL